MKGLQDDIRHAMRLYRRTPGASLGVVLIMALGMAFVTAFFTLYSNLTRSNRGFEYGARVVSINTYDGRQTQGLPFDLVERISQEASTLEYVAGSWRRVFFVGPSRKYTLADAVTKMFFSGVRPRLAMGRGFSAEDHNEHGEPVVIISWRYWQDQFYGQSDVLDKTLRIETSFDPPSAEDLAAGYLPTEFRIIGVADKTFTGLESAEQANQQSAFWIPIERVNSLTPPSKRAPAGRGSNMRVVARAAAGATNTAMANELNQRFDLSDVVQRPGAEYDVSDGIVEDVLVRRETLRQLKLLLASSVLLLVAAASNASLFLLARAPGRGPELATRRAVGASMRRLVRQLIAESAVLVTIASILGVACSMWLARLLPSLPFLRQAHWHDVTVLDWRVLTFVAAFLILTTLQVSLAPVRGLKRIGSAVVGRQPAARATFAQRVAGTTQLAVAGVLAATAIAFTWYLASLMLAYPGYKTRNLYAVTYAVTAAVDVSVVMEDRIRESFSGFPGVSTASVAMAAPGIQNPATGDAIAMVQDPANADKAIRVRFLKADSNYVGMLGLKILHGHNLTEKDPGGAIVNQAFAHSFYGRDDVVGAPLPDSVVRAARLYTRDVPRQIAGIVEDVSFNHPLEKAMPMIYFSGSSRFGGIVLVESSLPASSLLEQVRKSRRSFEVILVDEVVPLEKARRKLLAPDRARSLLTIGAAIIVVLVAAFGLYSTQRYLVMAGLREYAIRVAVGATPTAIARLVLGRALMLATPGMLITLPASVLLVAWLQDHYISRNVSPYAVSLLAACGLLVVTAIASIGPARVARRSHAAQLLRVA